MLNNNIKNALFSYGLSNEEIKVYLAVLSLGGATVREIYNITKIKRTTIYLIAERLIAKGLMGEYQAKYGMHYMVQTPRSLITKLENIKTEIEMVMPQLEALSKKDAYEPSVKFYKGRAGYVTILDDSLEKESQEVLYLGRADELNSIVGEKYILERYISTRLKKRITFKELVFPDKFSQNLKVKDASELRQTKFIPESYSFGANMLIYDNKVAYFSSRMELISVLIESRDIYQIEKQKFNLIWDNLS